MTDARVPALDAADGHGGTRLDEAMLILRELDRALSFHLLWLKNLHRTLICGETPRIEDLAHDAHCRCDFGRWYTRLPPGLLAKEPGIADLDMPHQAMHDAARQLLVRHIDGHISPSDYENFMDLATAFKQRLRTYQFDLVQRVCSVDQLTGVWNRNSMTLLLAAEAERTRRDGRASALCLLDLDHFKDVNDRYGHVAGDMVLQTVARYLKDNLRAYDSLFRYGGEEFLLCLPSLAIADAEPLINRLREQLAGTDIALPGGVILRVTASFGVAAMEPDDDISLAIERADHALLCAKSKGRNRVCVWSLTGDTPPGTSTG